MLGGLMGFMVSFASIWCMSRTSPTIYSLTGSLNKVRGSRNGVEGGVRRKCAGGQGRMVPRILCTLKPAR